MTSTNKKVLLVAAVLSVASMASAHAASITNSDGDAHALVITEDGVKNEIVIGVGETISVCASGCFITMPNGDRAALSGDENVSIIGGEAVISE